MEIYNKETDLLDTIPRIATLPDRFDLVVSNFGEYVIGGDSNNSSLEKESIDSNHPDNPDNSYPEDSDHSSQDFG